MEREKGPSPILRGWFCKFVCGDSFEHTLDDTHCQSTIRTGEPQTSSPFLACSVSSLSLSCQRSPSLVSSTQQRSLYFFFYSPFFSVSLWKVKSWSRLAGIKRFEFKIHKKKKERETYCAVGWHGMHCWVWDWVIAVEKICEVFPDGELSLSLLSHTHTHTHSGFCTLGPISSREEWVERISLAGLPRTAAM